MSLNVILGKSNTGKSEYIFKKIMACERENTQAILFVPSSGRVNAEKEYFYYTKKNALIDTEITTFERFVSRNINKETLYKNKSFLPKLAKKMLVKKTILENPDLFKIFNKVKDAAGFTDKVADYISKLKEIDMLNLLDKYENEDFLKAKFSEFVNIYNKVEENVKDRFVTSFDEITSFINSLTNGSQSLSSKEIFIDGYNNFNETEYAFIQTLLKVGNNVTITIDIDKEKYLDGETEIYNLAYDTINRLKNICITSGVEYNNINLTKNIVVKKPDVEFLADNLFGINRKTFDGETENVKLVLRPNEFEEIVFVAEDILKRLKEGYDLKDVVIYTNNIPIYDIYFKKVFEMYNLPVYIDAPEGLVSNNLSVYILTLLNIVLTGFNKSVQDILLLIKTGLMNLSFEEVCQFENYLLEFGIKGYNLKDAFTFNNSYDLENLNCIRTKILESVNALKQSLSNLNSANEITSIIYNFLIDNNIIQSYEKQLEYIKEIDVNEYNIKRQAVAKIYEIMDNISIAYENISLKEYVELLEYGIREIKLESIPAKLNQIEVLDINENRGIKKKIGYIIGCYDTGLPTLQAEDNIFTDIELEKLRVVGIDLKRTSTERGNMQLFNIYQAINKIQDRITLTVPSSLTLGAALRPSSLVNEIKDVLNVKLETVEINESLNLEQNFMEFLSSAVKLDEAVSCEEVQRLYTNYELYNNISRYKDIMNYLRKDVNLKKETLDKIYKKSINSSVSRLEQFNRCPFAYFTKYVLNVNEKKEYKMSKLDTGSFMHEVIEKFSKFIVAKDISWQDIILDEKIKRICTDKINEIVDKIFEEEYSKYITESRYIVLKVKLKKAMYRAIFAIADSFNHSEFRPLGYEIEFEKDALFAPIEVELEGGKKLLLRGKIDRIDSLKLENETYLRIVDYKSSDKNLRLTDVKTGISLQLMTYMWAMIENAEKIDKSGVVIPAALSYFTISNKLLNIPSYEQDETKLSEKIRKALKLRGIYIKDVEILKKLDNNIEDSKVSYLEVSKKTINNKEKVLDKDVFLEECKNVEKILKQIGKDIVEGKVSINPNKKINNVCEYCSYASICRKNILN